MDIKIGSKVAYIKYDISKYSSTQDVNWGYVFYVEDDCIGCARYKSSPTYIMRNSNFEKVYLVDENTKTSMKKIVNKELEDLKGKIKSITSEEKDELIKNEFNKIKQQIINTAKNMIECDENDFINKLKAICELKKQLFSIKISNLDNIHKANGGLKYKIKLLNNLIEKIDNVQFE